MLIIELVNFVFLFNFTMQRMKLTPIYQANLREI